MDPLGDLLTTRPIQTGWEICIEPYPNWLFRCVDIPDRQFGKRLVFTRTRTRSDGPEPLLTLGTPRPPLQQMERPAEDTVQDSWTDNWLESGQMPARADLWVFHHSGVRPGSDGLFGGHWGREISAHMKEWDEAGWGLGGSEAALAAMGLYYSFFVSFFLACFVYLLSFICQRGRRVAGGELRHLAGSPGGGGDIRVLSYSN